MLAGFIAGKLTYFVIIVVFYEKKEKIAKFDSTKIYCLQNARKRPKTLSQIVKELLTPGSTKLQFSCLSDVICTFNKMRSKILTIYSRIHSCNSKERLDAFEQCSLQELPYHLIK